MIRLPATMNASTRRCRLGAVVVLAVVGAAGCSTGTTITARPERTREGRQTYMRACAACHGPAARGDGPVAGVLTVSVPDLTRLAAEHDGTFPRDYVIGVITGERKVGAHGTREMPTWGQRFDPQPGTAVATIYTRQRLEMLASYLESLQDRP